jgi:hypothetical protein
MNFGVKNFIVRNNLNIKNFDVWYEMTLSYLGDKELASLW